MKKIKPKEIQTLTDLRLYRQDLELEAFKTEVKMQAGLSGIADALSPRNIIHSLTSDVSTLKDIFMTAFTFGKRLVRREKDKKRKKKAVEE
jgi:hypothetical protein